MSGCVSTVQVPRLVVVGEPFQVCVTVSACAEATVSLVRAPTHMVPFRCLMAESTPTAEGALEARLWLCATGLPSANAADAMCAVYLTRPGEAVHTISFDFTRTSVHMPRADRPASAARVPFGIGTRAPLEVSVGGRFVVGVTAPVTSMAVATLHLPSGFSWQRGPQNMYRSGEELVFEFEVTCEGGEGLSVYGAAEVCDGFFTCSRALGLSVAPAPFFVASSLVGCPGCGAIVAAPQHSASVWCGECGAAAVARELPEEWRDAVLQADGGRLASGDCNYDWGSEASVALAIAVHGGRALAPRRRCASVRSL